MIEIRRTGPSTLPTAAPDEPAGLAIGGREGERREHWRTAVLLALFAAVYLALGLSSVLDKSATWDEPQHLTAGLFAERAGDFRIDPEHPPLLRRWAALALPADAAPPTDAAALPTDWGHSWLGLEQFRFCHRFLFSAPDPDRLLLRARAMNLVLGVLLGGLLFLWAQELHGRAAAAAVLVLYAFEPNLLAHASLVTTDIGITLFLFAAVYFLWRLTNRFSWASTAGFAACAALAAVSKFSAPILAPLAALLLGVRVLDSRRWGPARTASRRSALAGGVLLLAGLTAWLGVWAAYGFRYQAAAGAAVVRLDLEPRVRREVPLAASAVGAAERYRLLPNAYAQGFLHGRSRAEARASYLLGEVSERGFRAYFPVAILAKTPLALLAAFLVGLALLLRSRGLASTARTRLLLLLPIAVYLGAAMASNLDIGLRHVLPIYPFLLLVAGAAIAEGLRRGRAVAVGLVCLLAAVEHLAVRPDYLAFFNAFAGGPGRGDAILVDSNLDWGQDLPGLARWMRQRGVARINFAYFGSADPGHYGIDANYLPGTAPFVAERVRPPELPGYVAVSVTHLRGPYLNQAGRELYTPLLGLEPVATIGHSIRVYWIDQGAPQGKRGG